MTVTEIIEKLKNTSGKNDKIFILDSNKENKELELVLSTTYSKTLNFFVRNFKVDIEVVGKSSLTDSIALLIDNISTRKYSGSGAKSYLETLVNSCSEPHTLLKVINRDLDCGVQVGSINKVWKDLIKKPPYMSYKLFDPKQIKKIKLPVISGVKLDGLFADIKVFNDTVVLSSREGKILDIPLTEALKADLLKVKDLAGSNVVLNGEALVLSDEENSLEGYADRATGNGYLNQDADKIDPSIIHFIVWDILTEDEYSNRLTKRKYKDRFYDLTSYLSNSTSGQILINESVVCNSYLEVVEHFSEVRKRGLEGTVVKEFSLLWKDGKLSSGGWKLKNEFSCDYLVVDTYPHKKDSSLIGGLTVTSSDGKVLSDVGSGLTDELRDKTSDYFVGKVVTIKANDLSYKDGRETVSLFLPRLVEIRTDKTEADDFDKIKQELYAYTDLIYEEISLITK